MEVWFVVNGGLIVWIIALRNLGDDGVVVFVIVVDVLCVELVIGCEELIVGCKEIVDVNKLFIVLVTKKGSIVVYIGVLSVSRVRCIL